MKQAFKVIIIMMIVTHSIQAYSQEGPKLGETNHVPVNFSAIKEIIRNKGLNGQVEVNSKLYETNKILHALEEISNPPASTSPQMVIPTNLTGLTGGWVEHFYSMNMESAAKVGFIPIGDLSNNLGKELYISEFMYYKDVADHKGERVRYGSGVRLIILAKKINAAANFSNLSSLAASAEFKFAEVNVEMRTVGLSGAPILAAAPPAGAYSVQKHVEYLQAIDKIKSKISDTQTVVTPEVISVSLDPSEKDKYLKPLYTSFGLQRISKGDSYITASNRLKVNDTFGREVLRSIYQDFTGNVDSTKPTAIQKLRAKEFLENID